MSTKYAIGEFSKGLENSKITDEMVNKHVEKISKSLLQIPRFKQLMERDVQVACEVPTEFPSICMNKVSFSEPNTNLVELKRYIKQKLVDELDKMIVGQTMNRNKMFNYYTNEYDYFYYKDVELAARNVYSYMTTKYYNDIYKNFNKIASNPWNNAKTKDVHQAYKIESNETEKLTFTKTYNHIENCFI